MNQYECFDFCQMVGELFQVVYCIVEDFYVVVGEYFEVVQFVDGVLVVVEDGNFYGEWGVVC